MDPLYFDRILELALLSPAEQSALVLQMNPGTVDDLVGLLHQPNVAA